MASRRRPGPAAAPEQVAQALALRRRGLPYFAIAERLGVSADMARAMVVDATRDAVAGDASVAKAAVIAEQADMMRGAAVQAVMDGDVSAVSAWMRVVEFQAAIADSDDRAESAGSISSAASTGDRRALLVAMRDRLAAAMDQSPVTVVAQIAAKLEHIAAAIEEIDRNRPERSVLDDLRARREARERAYDAASAAAGSGGSGGS